MRNRYHFILVQHLFLDFVQFLPASNLFTLNLAPTLRGHKVTLILEERSDFIDGGGTSWEQISLQVELELLERFQ